MKFLVILSAVVACAFAEPGLIAAGALGYGAPLGYAGPLGYGGPLGYAAPLAYAAPASLRTQYHAQDVLGQASYGHTEPLQTHNAIQDAAGNKIGSFSYLSPNGNVLRTDYVADALGYRVASNALPVGPSAPAAAGTAILARRRRDIVAPLAIGHTPAATAPLAYAATPAATIGYAAPLAYTTPFAAPIAYQGAAIRPGILTNIVNTPGHAVSYRVD